MGTVGKVDRQYRPHEIEEKVLKFWKEKGVYDKLRSMLKDKPKFYFLDGPPYPSSDVPHIGTAWNKVIKDLVIRFQRMRRRFVWDQPGYDTHGLPIEVAVEKRLGLRSKKEIVTKVGVEKFVKECMNLALTNANLMSKRFERLGVSMDWNNPYYTLKPEYIESGWWLIKKVHEQGLLKKGVKVVWWCPRCETVLADYEVQEYRNVEDPSIFVKFPLEGEKNRYLLIWTTTPWTLPANLAVMVHPEMEYVEVEYNGEKLILAEVRLEHVFSKLKAKPKVVARFKGKDLEGLRYVPPLLEEVDAQRKYRSEKTHRVVLSEFVTPYEGTGLVHSAPGHGEEDFIVAQRYGIPVVSLVDEKGIMVEDAGKYAGKHFREANKYIIEDLKRKGLLLYEEKVVHKYPVCWRCKTPLVLRATEQWYITVTKLKDKMLEEAVKVEWIPDWAKEREVNWLKELRDWVISRQRYWGIPLPVWECRKCGYRFIPESVDELRKHAINEVDLKDLHKPWIDRVVLKCPKCGGEMRRVPDVLDVWFDSGIAFFASLAYPKNKEFFEKMFPVDFIVEGHDQLRGWFFSLLRSGILGFGKAPYKRVLVHGYMLDEKGREMHKSLGNFVSADEVVEKYGADTLRFWVLQNTTWEDVRFGWKKLDLTFRDLNILWNVFVFASTYMNLDEFDPTKWTLDKVEKHLRIEDKWVLSKLNNLIKSVTESFEKTLVHEGVRRIREFIIEDLSHWYIRLIRRRVWIEAEDPDKLAAYSTLYTVLKTLLQLLAPVTPFITEELYQKLVKPAEPNAPESIHMLEWPKVREELIRPELEEAMNIAKKVVEAGAAARMKAGIKIRQPLPELIVLSDGRELHELLGQVVEIVKSQINVKNIKIAELREIPNYIEYEIIPNYSKIGPLFKEKTRDIVEKLGEKANEVSKELLEKGKYEIEIEGRKYVITLEHVEIKEKPREHYVIQDFDRGKIVLDTRIDYEAAAEGLARDIVRRIQYMRKELDLPVEAFIEAIIVPPDKQSVEMLMKWKNFIAEEVRASKLEITLERREVSKGYVKEWDIGGDKYLIAVIY